MNEQNPTITDAGEIDDVAGHARRDVPTVDIDETDDVQGHARRDADETDDVEGHARRDADDTEDDVQGHFRRA